MAKMIHQNGKSDTGSQKRLDFGANLRESLKGAAKATAARVASAPAFRCPPLGNTGGKPAGKARGHSGAHLGQLGLMAKYTIKGVGAVRFKGFVLYRKDTDAYFVLRRKEGPVVMSPDRAEQFPTYEAAAMAKPEGQAGWQVLALYESRSKLVVMTV